MPDIKALLAYKKTPAGHKFRRHCRAWWSIRVGAAANSVVPTSTAFEKALNLAYHNIERVILVAETPLKKDESRRPNCGTIGLA